MRVPARLSGRALFSGSALLGVLAGFAMSSTDARAQTPQNTSNDSVPTSSQPTGIKPAGPNNSTALSEVVVTARRVAERVESVPISINAISAETLRRQDIVDISALSELAPSFTAVRFGGRGSGALQMEIRGQQTGLPGILNEPAVTIYFADVGSALAVGSDRSIYDLTSVQVLNGPQGTLFGRNTTGGAVLLTPNSPEDVFDGYMQAKAGNYSYVDVEGMLNMPVSDKLAIRFAGKITRRDGYMYNPYTGNHAENLHSDDARLSVLWSPTADLKSTAIVTYSDNDVINTDRLSVIAPQALFPGELALLQAALANIQAAGPYGYDDSAPQFSHTTVYNVIDTTQLTLHTSLDSLNVKNIFGFQSIRDDDFYDTDGEATVQIYQEYVPTDARTFSDEIQLYGSEKNLDFIAGFIVDDMAGSERTFADVFGFTGDTFFSYTDVDANNLNYAFYSHANYKLDSLLSGLSISAGVRVSEDVRKVVYHNRQGSSAAPGIYDCTLTGAVIPDNRALCATPAELRDTEPTYDVSLNWQLRPNTLLYATYRHGYKTGGFNASPGTVAQISQEIILPEKIDDFEGGLKTDFSAGGMTGQFDVAGYFDRVTNLQREETRLVPGAVAGTNIAVGAEFNVPLSYIDGVEASLTVKPWQPLTLSVNGSIINTEYKDFFDEYAVNGVETPVNVSDSTFEIPKYRAHAMARFEFPLPPEDGNVSIEGDLTYQSDTQTNFINTSNCGPNGQYLGCLNRLGVLPGRTLVNMRLDWRNVANKGFDLAFFVNNVANKLYYNISANALSAIGTDSVIVGEPRMFGVELRVPFGASAYR